MSRHLKLHVFLLLLLFWISKVSFVVQFNRIVLDYSFASFEVFSHNVDAKVGFVLDDQAAELTLEELRSIRHMNGLAMGFESCVGYISRIAIGTHQTVANLNRYD